MRALVALVLVAACATTPEPPPERLAGCWIARDDRGGATVMRWLPDPERAGALAGEKSSMSGAVERYRLEPRGAGWALCELTADGERCWQVAQGEEGSLEGGRAFIDTHGESLRITVLGDGAERTVFQGQRDGCD